MVREFQRALPVDFDVSGRNLEGIALRWDHPYTVSDDGRVWYREGWRAGSFTDSIDACANVFELRRYHRDSRIGRASFAQSAEGLVFRALVEPTPAGDSALERVITGKDRGVSIRYETDRHKRDAQGTYWRQRGWLRELSLTPYPQYEDAMVTMVRAHSLSSLRQRSRQNVRTNVHWL